MRVKELREQLNKYKDDDEIIVSLHHKSDYQLHDQELSEQVFNALKNHIEPKTHYGVIFGQDRGSCPECGSDEIVIQMRRTTS